MQENTSEKFSVVRTFEIKGCNWGDNCLPSYNDTLSEATRHPMAYGRLKKKMDWACIEAIRRDLKGWQATTRVRLDITWGERIKGGLRDYDNIVSARKFINDALTKTKTIPDDNPRFLGYGENTFVYTDKPFIRVEIVEIEEFKK